MTSLTRVRSPRHGGAFRAVAAAVALTTLAGATAAQGQAPDTRQQGGRRPPPRIYDETTPIVLTLTTNIEQLRQDRDTNPRWRWGQITLAGDTGTRGTVPVRVRPRGVWRRRQCRFPPLRLDFARATSEGTVFAGLDRPKLVNYCYDEDRYEQYILQEYQLYRVYALLTPRSMRTRLLRVTYADSTKGRTRTTRYAILTEDAGALAARLGGTALDATGITSAELDSLQFAVTSLFQYMIGNTDWSTAGLHNMEIVQTGDGTMYPIAYDFDFSGAVDAHYAVPPAVLRLPSVRTRLFRGPCLAPEMYERAFALFRERREAIRALYHDDIGARIRSATVRRTLAYFDDFFEIIDDPRRVKRDILDACLKDI